jgi:hypothetical protein
MPDPIRGTCWTIYYLDKIRLDKMGICLHETFGHVDIDFDIYQNLNPNEWIF